MWVEIDSCSSKTMMDEVAFSRILENQNITLNKPKSKATAYGGSEIPLLGSFSTTIETRKKIVPDTIMVVKGETGSRPLLAGKTAFELGILAIPRRNHCFDASPDTLGEFCSMNPDLVNDDKKSQGNAKVGSQVRTNKMTDDVNSSEDIPDCIKDFSHVFSNKLGKHKYVKVKLHVDKSSTPMAQPPRKIPFYYQERLSEHLKKLKENDIIEDAPTDRPTTWVSNLVFAPKPKGPDPTAIRFCVDSRVPNKAIRRNLNNLPTVHDILLALNGAQVFSHLDMNSGYHQLELDERSRDVTTFYTHEGLKRYKRLPFGIISAQDEFDRAIRRTISGVPGARNITDDIIVFGRNKEDHDKNLREVFRRLLEAGLTLKKSKCKFNQSEITFFGLIVSRDGIKPDPSKVDALRTMTEPKSKEDVRSMLSMASASRMFIEDFSKIMAPLRELTKQTVKFTWGREQQSALEKLRDCLSEDNVLGFFEIGKPTEIHVDFHKTGLGATMLQEENGKWRPIMYISRSTTLAESRYSQTEGEALAARWACERLRVFLIGGSFTIVTDHRPLIPMLSNPFKKLPIRIERMMMYMQEFTFTIEYRPGKDNISDYLSRHAPSEDMTRTPPTICKKCDFEEEIVKSVCGSFKLAVPNAVSLEELKLETSRDEILRKVKKILQVNSWQQFKQDPDIRPFSRSKMNFQL